MAQAADRLDLAEEPLRADRRRHLGVEHLEGDRAVVLEILGQEHGRHATPAQLALNPVAGGDGGGQALQDGGTHVRLPAGRAMPRAARTALCASSSIRRTAGSGRSHARSTAARCFSASATRPSRA